MMFTGIIREVGRLKGIKKMDTGLEYEIECVLLMDDIATGDSISVNGCCLTVKSFTDKAFKCDLSFSTIGSTNFSTLRPGSLLNLEDALRVGGKLGGHFVTGHVDGVLTIKRIEKRGDFFLLEVFTDPSLSRFIAPKGSIAIDGISLTIAESRNDSFTVALISHSFYNTNLQYKRESQTVNAEIDMLARYIYNILRPEEKDLRDKKIKEMLERHGFTKK
jgi:riboflavin synthase